MSGFPTKISPTDKTEKSYTITLQRESNFLDILSAIDFLSVDVSVSIIAVILIRYYEIKTNNSNIFDSLSHY